MKKSKKLMIALALGCVSLFAVSCNDEPQDETGSDMLSVTSVSPTIVMEGTEVTIVGSGLDKVTDVIFPGNISAATINKVNAKTIKVVTPEGIDSGEAALIVKTESAEVVSKQKVRKAAPAFTSFDPAESAETQANLVILGDDLINVAVVHFDNGIYTGKIEAIEFISKSNTRVELFLSGSTPLGAEVEVTAEFANGETMALGTLEIIKGEGGAFVQKEITIYSGEPVVIGNWEESIRFEAAIFKDVKADDVIRVYITDPAEDFQQGVIHKDWAPAVEGWGEVGLEDDHFEKGYYEVTITEEALAVLKTDGMRIRGKGYTATKVSIFTTVWDDGSEDITDPITDYTIMLVDYPATGDHNYTWDASWTEANKDKMEFITELTGNVYARIKEPIDKGWLMNCSHVDNGIVYGIKDYELKIDIKIEEGAVGASSVPLEFVIGDVWCEAGECLPESTDGKWVTLRFDIGELWAEDFADNDFSFIDGDEIKGSGLYMSKDEDEDGDGDGDGDGDEDGGGTETKTGSTTEEIWLPAGVCFDNLRLDPK